LQVDGGVTYTEPSAIISGPVEGQEEVCLPSILDLYKFFLLFQIPELPLLQDYSFSSRYFLHIIYSLSPSRLSFDSEQVVVRVHDACFTSEVLGSLKCDCREQLQLALDYIQDEPPGMVIYLQQEGRGIGLANKIAAYSLQEKGLDTVDANRALGLPDDCREYSAVGHILQELGVKSIRLMTNNPRKINELAALGINVVDRVPCLIKAQKYNKGYLSAKQKRMKHILEEEEALEGQYCFWDHDGEPGSAGISLESGVPLEDAARILEQKKKVAAEAAAAVKKTGVVSSHVANVGLANKRRSGTPSDYECGGSAGATAT